MSRLGGYTGKILRIDLTKGVSKVTELERALARGFLGGRGFNVKRMYDEIPPGPPSGDKLPHREPLQHLREIPPNRDPGGHQRRGPLRL